MKKSNILELSKQYYPAFLNKLDNDLVGTIKANSKVSQVLAEDTIKVMQLMKNHGMKAEETLEGKAKILRDYCNEVFNTKKKTIHFKNNLKYWLNEGLEMEDIMEAIRLASSGEDRFFFDNIKTKGVEFILRIRNNNGSTNYVEAILTKLGNRIKLEEKAKAKLTYHFNVRGKELDKFMKEAKPTDKKEIFNFCKARGEREDKTELFGKDISDISRERKFGLWG